MNSVTNAEGVGNPESQSPPDNAQVEPVEDITTAINDEESSEGESDDSAAFTDADSEADESDGSREHLPEFPLYPSTQPGFERDSDPELPDNVTVLKTEAGSTVYLVGTAHFSRESQDDVVKTIERTKPDIVMLELCSSRVNILQLDEDTLRKEAKNITFTKMQQAVKQSGLVQGVMHLLLLTMSAHLTDQLGMAPGGEFRVALQEARRISMCRVQLGDRPIQVTLRRALGSLSWWQTIRLAWYILTSKEPISKEDVEKYKQKDFLEEMLREMTGEFPALSQVFVLERDLYLARSLRNAASLLPSANGKVPSVVVGVVGIGHTPGIVEKWNSVDQLDLEYLMEVPPPSAVSRAFKISIRAALVVLVSWGCYRGYRWGSSYFH